MSIFTHTAGQKLQVGDSKIYFEFAGNPTGKPLLLLHGGMGNLTDFNEVVNKLPPEYRLLGIDFRGHGKSTLGTSRMTYKQHQSDVETVLEHLGIDSFAVIGFSDGGVTALRMAAESPSRITALVAVAAHSQMDSDDPILPILRGITAEKWEARFPNSVVNYKSNNPEPDFDRLVKAVVGLWTDIDCSDYPGAMVKLIAAPTLLVRGDEDHLYSLKCGIELRDQINNADLLNIPDAGHEVYKDAPILFLEAVNKFLEKYNGH